MECDSLTFCGFQNVKSLKWLGLTRLSHEWEWRCPSSLRSKLVCFQSYGIQKWCLIRVRLSSIAYSPWSICCKYWWVAVASNCSPRSKCIKSFITPADTELMTLVRLVCWDLKSFINFSWRRRNGSPLGRLLSQTIRWLALRGVCKIFTEMLTTVLFRSQEGCKLHLNCTVGL